LIQKASHWKKGRFKIIMSNLASATEFEEKLQSLAAMYAERLPNKISEIEKVWQRLQNEWDQDGLVVMHRLVHSLSGSGKTFGFADLSIKARILEQNLKRIAQLGKAIDDTEYLEINNQIAALNQASKSGDTSQASVNLTSVITNDISSFDLNSIKKIIIVDDDEEAAQEIKLQLEYFGHNVDYFKQIDEFRSAILENPDAIVLMNIEFPDDSLGGINMINNVQGMLDKPIKVIFISAHDSLEIRLGAVRAGSLAYFTKPINSSELIDSIDVLTSVKPQEPFRVLIVDDSASLLSFHSAILQQAGMTVSTVQDPMNIMNTLLEFDPDIILMDMYMPECSGVELAKVIRQLDNIVSTPIVYLSSEDDFNTQLEAMSLGGDDFLVKPIEPSQLISAITSRILRARMLRSYMVLDSLTGLYNHTAIKEQLDREIARSGRLKSKLTFAMVDIDFFKNVNDSYGHSAGDRVIKSLARLLKQRLRSTDIIGRYGGEEFAVILTDTDATSAAKVMNDIRKVFSRLVHISDGKEFSVSFSCGVADLTHYPDAVALGNAADKALYHVKENGRNSIMQYPEGTGMAVL